MRERGSTHYAPTGLRPRRTHSGGSFGDTNSGCALGLAAAVRGAAAPEWEVRNAANLCFAALVTRVVGYSNIHKVRHHVRTSSPLPMRLC